MPFYELFSSTYKRRKQLYPSEFMLLSRLRKNFDRSYPYAARLNSLCQDKKFLNTNFNKLFKSIRIYYRKANRHILKLKNTIQAYRAVLMIKKQEDLRKAAIKKTKEGN